MAEPTPASATPDKPAGGKPGKRTRAAGKKEKKSIPHAVATVAASFNNTVIAIADQEGGILAWSSAGRIG
ncbi:MAG: 30S ribosomal protein S11, partial [Acidobacteriota bacterium]